MNKVFFRFPDMAFNQLYVLQFLDMVAERQDEM